MRLALFILLRRGNFLFFSALSLLGFVALTSVKTRRRTTWGATVEARV